MSEENISDDELTALFGDDEENDGGDGPPVEDSGGGSSPSEGELIKTHDWGEKRRLSTDQMRTLNDLHDQFAKSYGPALSISMKRQVDIRLSDEPRQTTYGEFVAALPNPTSLNRFVLPPLEGPAAINMDLALALPIIDRMLGGTGDAIEDDEIRAPTQIEERVLQRVLKTLLETLQTSWSKVIDVEPAFTTAESIPYYLQLTQLADDVVVVAEFDVAIRDEFGPILEGAKLSICYPYILLQPITAKLRSGSFASAGGMAINKDLRDSLEKVKVPLYGILVRDRLRMHDMLEMEVGDVLTFRTNLDEASEVVIGKNRVFWARPGVIGRRHALRVEAFINPEQSSPLELTTDTSTDEASSTDASDEVEQASSSSSFGVRMQ